jgi:hypothetical protein
MKAQGGFVKVSRDEILRVFYPCLVYFVEKSAFFILIWIGKNDMKCLPSGSGHQNLSDFVQEMER